MTDRLKVSLFDTLVPYGIEGARVLDLYAGSGSLGIEMLSRGAEWADFVEQNSTMCRLISDNLRTTRLAERAHVYKMWVARFLTMKRHQAEGTPHGVTEDEQESTAHTDGGAEYDIILLDPPYADPAIEATMETVALAPYLSGEGLVVIGHATQVKLADEYGGGRIVRARHREMGGSAFSIYERV